MKSGSKDELPEVKVLPFPKSICHGCANCRVVATKTSKFLMCTVLAGKYPRQPVSNCTEFKVCARKTKDVLPDEPM